MVDEYSRKIWELYTQAPELEAHPPLLKALRKKEDDRSSLQYLLTDAEEAKALYWKAHCRSDGDYDGNYHGHTADLLARAASKGHRAEDAVQALERMKDLHPRQLAEAEAGNIEACLAVAHRCLLPDVGFCDAHLAARMFEKAINAGSVKGCTCLLTLLVRNKDLYVNGSLDWDALGRVMLRTVELNAWFGIVKKKVIHECPLRGCIDQKAYKEALVGLASRPQGHAVIELFAKQYSEARQSGNMSRELAVEARWWPARLHDVLNALLERTSDLQARLSAAESELERLREENRHLRYAPGGPGYEQAKEHFENAVDSSGAL